MVSNSAILGDDGNNTLTNNNASGFTLMGGGAGNDTYIVKDIFNNYTVVDEDDGNNDILFIQNVTGKDLVFLFDVKSDNSYFSPSDQFYIIHKDKLNIFKDEYKDFWLNGYDIAHRPQSGAVEINTYFGNTNDIQGNGQYGTDYGPYHLEKIYATTATGAKYAFNLKDYISTVTAKVKTFLADKAYDTAMDVFLSDNEADKTALLNLYKNTPISFSVQGGDRNDTIEGGSLADTLKGGNGNDKLLGGSGNDKLYGENGNDIIKAGAGNDAIWGGKGDDTIELHSGNNIMYFEAGDGNDTVVCGTGSDILQFNSLANSGLFTTTLDFSSANDKDLTIKNKNTDDTVTIKDFFASNSIKKVKSQNGSNMALSTLISKVKINVNAQGAYNGRSHHEYITGSADDDVINGNGGNDTIVGGSGNDKLKGGEGNDRIEGGNGNDAIEGGVGNDALYGMAGNDSINAGDGNDFINGGAGDDKIWCVAGDNRVIGEKGADTMYAGVGADTFEFAEGSGKDILYNTNQDDIIKFTDVNKSDITAKLKFVKKDNHLLIQRKGTTDEIKIMNFFTADAAQRVDKIVTKDGQEVSIKEQQLNITVKGMVTTTEFSEAVNGSSGDDNITLGAGDDVVAPGKGNDIVHTGTGVNKIIINKGDGDVTIYSDGTKTTLKVNGASLSDVVTLRANNTDLILKYSHPMVGGEQVPVEENVTFKNYFNADGSIKDDEIYLQSTNIQKLSDLVYQQKVVIYKASAYFTTIEGDNNDNRIVIDNSSNATVYAYGGDDGISIKGNEFDVHPGAGNDMIILGEGANGTVYINNGDGNNEIYNLENAYEYGDLYIQSDDLIRQFREYKYVLAERNDNDLILKLTDGQSTIKVKDFYGLSDMVKWNTLRLNNEEYKPGLHDYLVFDEPVVTYLPTNQVTSTISDDYSLVVAEDNGIARTINLNSNRSHLWMGGNQNHTLNVNGGNNKIYMNNSSNCDTTINGEYNSVYINSLGADITISGTNRGNFIKDNSTSGSTITTSTTFNALLMYNNGISTIESWGDDQIQLYNNYVNIRYHGPWGKDIIIDDVNAKGAIISNFVSATNMTQIRYLYEKNVDVVFMHNPKDLEKGKDDIIYLYAKNEENGNYNKNGIGISGLWKLNEETSKYEFDLDTDKYADNIRVRAGSSKDLVPLNGLTQYLDFGKSIFYDEGGDHIFNNRFLFNRDLKQYGLLDHRKDTYIRGTNADDSYEYYNFTQGRFTIDDRGSDEGVNAGDVLYISTSRDGYRFFMDIDRNGNLVNGDLLIFQHTNSLLTDGLAQYIGNSLHPGDLDYIDNWICLKNQASIDENGHWVDGAGAIEYINDVDNHYGYDLEALYGNVCQDVASWITSYNTAHGTNFDTVTQAIQDRHGTADELTNLLNIYVTDGYFEGL